MSNKYIYRRLLIRILQNAKHMPDDFAFNSVEIKPNGRLVITGIRHTATGSFEKQYSITEETLHRKHDKSENKKEE